MILYLVRVSHKVTGGSTSSLLTISGKFGRTGTLLRNQPEVELWEEDQPPNSSTMTTMASRLAEMHGEKLPTHFKALDRRILL